MPAGRPYVVASCAMSVDGYLDDASDRRLVLSGEADLDRVDEVRAGCDAILVGAGTVRADDPRLLLRSDVRRERRVAAGLPGDPVKVLPTASGDVDPAARFFAAGEGEKLAYAASPAVAGLRERLGARARVVDAGDPPDLDDVLADLRSRGVRRLLVEGGSRVLTEFLAADLVDELHLAVAPFFVGEEAAPRLVGPGAFPYAPGRGRGGGGRMRLAGVRPVGDMAVLRYLLGADRYWLGEAVEHSRHCPQSATAFAVGAVLVDAEGHEMARGYSRESAPDEHAEEAALAKVDPADPRLATATLYTSLEPCSVRGSRPRPCADLVVDAGVTRVVLAWREPALFVDCQGVEQLRDAGVEVVELPELAAAAQEVNRHLFE